MTSLIRTPPTFCIMVEGELQENQTPETGRWYCGFTCPEWADDPVDGALAK